MGSYGESDETAVFSFNDYDWRVRPDRPSRPCQEGGHYARKDRGSREKGRAHARSAPGTLLDHQYFNGHHYGAIVREGSARGGGQFRRPDARHEGRKGQDRRHDEASLLQQSDLPSRDSELHDPDRRRSAGRWHRRLRLYHQG